MAVGGVLGSAGCLSQVQPGEHLGVVAADAAGPWGEGVDRVVVTHGADPDIGMAISSASSPVDGRRQTVRYDLKNATRRSFETNPFSWTVWREDEGWTRLYPEILPMPSLRLEPGSSLYWWLTLDHAGTESGEYEAPEKASKEGVTIRGVRPGQHAVSIAGSFPSGDVRFVSRFAIAERDG